MAFMEAGAANVDNLPATSFTDCLQALLQRLPSCMRVAKLSSRSRQALRWAAAICHWVAAIGATQSTGLAASMILGTPGDGASEIRQPVPWPLSIRSGATPWCFPSQTSCPAWANPVWISSAIQQDAMCVSQIARNCLKKPAGTFVKPAFALKRFDNECCTRRDRLSALTHLSVLKCCQRLLDETPLLIP